MVKQAEADAVSRNVRRFIISVTLSASHRITKDKVVCGFPQRPRSYNLSNLKLVKIWHGRFHQRQIHFDEVVLDASCLRGGKNSLQSSVPSPTGTMDRVFADYPGTCTEMNRP